jgi:hypothetical protein
VRITKNAKEAICPICKEVMKIGELGTNFMLNVPHIQRAHIDCVKKIHEERMRNNVSSK